MEVDCTVSITYKDETGDSTAKKICLKEYRPKTTPGTVEFFDEVLDYVKAYRLRPDPRQKTLSDAKEKATAEKKAEAIPKKIKGDKMVPETI